MVPDDINSLLACFDKSWGLAPRGPSQADVKTDSPTRQSPTMQQSAAYGSEGGNMQVTGTASSEAGPMQAAAWSKPINPSPIPFSSSASHRSIPADGGQASGSFERKAYMFPMTPPPPHGPISAAKLIPNMGLVGPMNHHPVVVPVPAVPVAPANGGSTAGNTRADFASVFFSPIPLSYLNMPRSESHDSILAQSIGSPLDATHRGGRLSTAALNSEWAEEEEANGLSPLQAITNSNVSIPGPSMPSRKSRTAAAVLSPLSPPTNLQTVVVGSHSSTSPDSVLSSEAPPAAGAPAPTFHPSGRPAARVPGALVGLPDDLLPPMPNLGLLHGTGLSIAAAAAAKKNNKWGTLRLVAGTAMIPHIDKVEKGGEDAFCVCYQGLGSIGVADGVSGWAEEGIDPAAYSRSLMRFASEALDANRHPNGPDPREVIRHAHMATVMAGSSTVCIAVMKPNSKMQIANLGDSGVRLIRGGRMVFASTAQQHMFNMPFQLSHPSIIESPDDADSADVVTLDVQPGDILIMATDGLYDNVFDEEITKICMETLVACNVRVPSTESEAELVAAAVARTAHSYAQNPSQRTPWSVAASETGLPWARFFLKGGGKMDDVTVVVGFVVEDAA